MKFKEQDRVFFFEKREDVVDIEHEGIIDSIGFSTDPENPVYMVKILKEKGEYTIIAKKEDELMTIEELLSIPIN